MADYHNIKEYFSLLGPSPVLGKTGQEWRAQVQLFAGVALGAVAKVVYDALSAAGPVAWSSVVIALIASVVVYPQFYYGGGLNKKKLNFAHWSLAFQNGFFWSVAMNTLLKEAGGAG